MGCPALRPDRPDHVPQGTPPPSPDSVPYRVSKTDRNKNKPVHVSPHVLGPLCHLGPGWGWEQDVSAEEAG